MWKDEGACNGHETNIYFEIYEENAKIREIIDSQCNSCPVNRLCFAEGVSGKEWGVWGGVYLEDGVISKEFNDHKSKNDWQTTWQSLTME